MPPKVGNGPLLPSSARNCQLFEVGKDFKVCQACLTSAAGPSSRHGARAMSSSSNTRRGTPTTGTGPYGCSRFDLVFFFERSAAGCHGAAWPGTLTGTAGAEGMSISRQCQSPNFNFLRLMSRRPPCSLPLDLKTVYELYQPYVKDGAWTFGLCEMWCVASTADPCGASI